MTFNDTERSEPNNDTCDILIRNKNDPINLINNPRANLTAKKYQKNIL
jgi:hypothetical protein